MESIPISTLLPSILTICIFLFLFLLTDTKPSNVWETSALLTKAGQSNMANESLGNIGVNVKEEEPIHRGFPLTVKK